MTRGAARRVLVIQGHPDRATPHLCHALADAYAAGAAAAGHDVRRLEVAALGLPLLRSKADWEAPADAAVRAAQDAIAGAEHLVLVYPMWLGDMPALLKGFLEQVLRPGFALQAAPGGGFPKPALGGRSARVVVTMGMPAAIYRWWFRAHALHNLRRNVLGFVGIRPVHSTLVGMADGLDEAGRARWLGRLEALGRAGA